MTTDRAGIAGFCSRECWNHRAGGKLLKIKVLRDGIIILYVWLDSFTDDQPLNGAKRERHVKEHRTAILALTPQRMIKEDSWDTASKAGARQPFHSAVRIKCTKNSTARLSTGQQNPNSLHLCEGAYLKNSPPFCNILEVFLCCTAE